MPTYQYACTECGHAFEQFQSFTDDALTECPECRGRLRKLFNAVGVVFKGSGFYRNDSRAPAGASGTNGSSGGSDGSSGAGDSGATTGAKDTSSASKESSGAGSGSGSSSGSGSGSGSAKSTAATGS